MRCKPCHSKLTQVAEAENTSEPEAAKTAEVQEVLQL